MKTNKIIEAMLFYEAELRCNENLQEHNRTKSVRIEHEIILRALAYCYKKLMKGISVIILLIGFGCISQKNLPEERFYFEKDNVYHISSYGDTTLLNSADIRALKIDSLNK